MERRPSATGLAEMEELERKQWPSCRQCGVQTYPGKPCDLSRCPWQRDDGKVVGTRVGGAPGVPRAEYDDEGY
jgi:hypothetical protein